MSRRSLVAVCALAVSWRVPVANFDGVSWRVLVATSRFGVSRFESIIATTAATSCAVTGMKCVVPEALTAPSKSFWPGRSSQHRQPGRSSLI